MTSSATDALVLRAHMNYESCAEQSQTFSWRSPKAEHIYLSIALRVRREANLLDACDQLHGRRVPLGLVAHRPGSGSELCLVRAFTPFATRCLDRSRTYLNGFT